MTEKLPQCVEDNKCFYYYHLSKMPNSAFNKHIDIVELKYEDGMFISFASFSMYPSVSNTFYNFSLLRDIEKNQEKFTKIIREAKRRVLPLPLLSFTQSDETILKNNKFMKIGKENHMVLELKGNEKSHPLPENYSFGEITATNSSDGIWDQWFEVFNEGFSIMNKKSIRNVISNAECGKNSSLRHFYVYNKEKSKMVTIVSLYFDKNVCGIYNMASLKSERGKKLGRRLLEYTHFDIAREEKKCTTFVLQASTLSIPLYERFGYKLVESPTLWVRLRQASFPVRNLGGLYLMIKNGEIWKYVLPLVFFVIFVLVVKIIHQK
jgi:GNAT superfamily N-acetyltransferase